MYVSVTHVSLLPGRAEVPRNTKNMLSDVLVCHASLKFQCKTWSLMYEWICCYQNKTKKMKSCCILPLFFSLTINSSKDKATALDMLNISFSFSFYTLFFFFLFFFSFFLCWSPLCCHCINRIQFKRVCSYSDSQWAVEIGTKVDTQPEILSVLFHVWDAAWKAWWKSTALSVPQTSFPWSFQSFLSVSHTVPAVNSHGSTHSQLEPTRRNHTSLLTTD